MFSVLMSIYNGEKTEFFVNSIESVLSQSLFPDEIILIRDGKVYEELQKTIDTYLEKYPSLFSYYPFDANGGLGNALKYGVEHSKYDLIIRMDTDDICESDRFKKQIEYMDCHPDISVLGGQIYEFIDQPNIIYDKRLVPVSYQAIGKFIKKRNPFNHVTVVFRKNDVLNAGNYQDLLFLEDYYLWCRMFAQGYRFANLDDILVRVRINQNTFKRRSGLKYIKSYLTLEKYKYDNKITDFFLFCYLIMARFFVHVLLPDNIRVFIFKKIARN